MYEEYYKLKENPFTIEPDPEYLYLSPKHENALAYLRYGLIKKAAFTLKEQSKKIFIKMRY